VFDASYEELVAALMLGRRTMRELRDNQFGRRYYASLVEPKRKRRARPARARKPRAPSCASLPAWRAAMSLADLAGDDRRC